MTDPKRRATFVAPDVPVLEDAEVRAVREFWMWIGGVFVFCGIALGAVFVSILINGVPL